MTDAAAAPSNNNSHLETIDYKPPAVPTQPMPDEKKTDDDHDHDHDRDNDHHHDNEHDNEHDDVDLYSEEIDQEWDEGGNSHCGYNELIHTTLMTVGETVHSVIGEPSPHIEKELKAVGNWFQEASYAARDLFRASGKEGGEEDGDDDDGMKEDALDAVKTLFQGGSSDSKKRTTSVDAPESSSSSNPTGEGNEENKDPTSTTA